MLASKKKKRTTPNWRASAWDPLDFLRGFEVGLGGEANAIIAKKLNLIEYLIDVLGVIRLPPSMAFHVAMSRATKKILFG